MTKATKGLAKAINFFGNQNRMAKALGVTRQAVTFWVSGSAQISAKNVLKVHYLTGGKVTPYDLRPDIYPKEFKPKLARRSTDL